MTKFQLRHQEISVYPMILEHHVNVLQGLMHEQPASESPKYIFAGRQLQQIHQKVVKLIMKGPDRRGNYNLSLSEAELYAILITPWEGLNNNFIHNLESAMVKKSFEYYINQTLSPIVNPFKQIALK